MRLSREARSKPRGVCTHAGACLCVAMPFCMRIDRNTGTFRKLVFHLSFCIHKPNEPASHCSAWQKKQKLRTFSKFGPCVCNASGDWHVRLKDVHCKAFRCKSTCSDTCFSWRCGITTTNKCGPGSVYSRHCKPSGRQAVAQPSDLPAACRKTHACCRLWIGR